MAGLVKRYAALDVKMNGRFGPSTLGACDGSGANAAIDLMAAESPKNPMLQPE